MASGPPPGPSYGQSVYPSPTFSFPYSTFAPWGGHHQSSSSDWEPTPPQRKPKKRRIETNEEITQSYAGFDTEGFAFFNDVPAAEEPQWDHFEESRPYDSQFCLLDQFDTPPQSFRIVPAIAAGRPLHQGPAANGIDEDFHSSASSISVKQESSNPQTPSTAIGEARKAERRSSSRNLSSSKYLKSGASNDDEYFAERPELTESILNELNDISQFRKDDRYRKLIVDYEENISFPLGEGGRELLRACLNVRGCKGRQLQGASVPSLLALAKQWGLWDVAIRIKVERSSGVLCPQHEAFVRFKATQSQMRKHVKKEYMVTERDTTGKISKILYDESRKITLGKEGREALRAQLRRLHDKHAHKMDELLEHHGFKYSELRNATVQQLSRMAFVCNLWDQVVHACRKQEEKRETKAGKEMMSPTPMLPISDVQLPSPSTTTTYPQDFSSCYEATAFEPESLLSNPPTPAAALSSMFPTAEMAANLLVKSEPTDDGTVAPNDICIEDFVKYANMWYYNANANADNEN